MNLKGKKVMVIGLARTGSETARFLVRQGAEVLVSDLRGKQELRGEIESLRGLPLRLLFGGEEVSWLDGVDTLVPSPGVPAQNPLLLQASRRGIEIISEVELASRFLRVPLVAIRARRRGRRGESPAGVWDVHSGLSLVRRKAPDAIDHFCSRLSSGLWHREELHHAANGTASIH